MQLVDLRSFGAIGFQDAPNGLWLGKQGYRPQEKLLERIVNSAIGNSLSAMAITSEDDKMLPGFPEDRFGFLKRQADGLPQSYNVSEDDNRSLKIYNGKKELTLINSETVHAPRGQDWKGVKLHVVGGNLIPKLDIGSVAKYCADKGYMTFLMNVGTEEAQRVADKVIGKVTGVVTHDANNTFYSQVKFAPLLGRALAPYTRDNNEAAKEYAMNKRIPGIAVSSSHWMHQMGRAGIYVSESSLRDKPIIEGLKTAIEKGLYTMKRLYNSQPEVFRFGIWMKGAGDPERFKGTTSSYNYSAEGLERDK